MGMNSIIHRMIASFESKEGEDNVTGTGGNGDDPKLLNTDSPATHEQNETAREVQETQVPSADDQPNAVPEEKDKGPASDIAQPAEIQNEQPAPTMQATETPKDVGDLVDAAAAKVSDPTPPVIPASCKLTDKGLASDLAAALEAADNTDSIAGAGGTGKNFADIFPPFNLPTPNLVPGNKVSNEEGEPEQVPNTGTAPAEPVAPVVPPSDALAEHAAQDEQRFEQNEQEHEVLQEEIDQLKERVEIADDLDQVVGQVTSNESITEGDVKLANISLNSIGRHLNTTAPNFEFKGGKVSVESLEDVQAFQQRIGLARASLAKAEAKYKGKK